MRPRMRAGEVPDVLPALQTLGAAAEKSSVPPLTLDLVKLRASLINGGVHPGFIRKHGKTDERLFSVIAWRDAPYFTDAERAALALTEAVTRLADRSDPVPDEI